MLRDDLIEAVARGQFHIHPVSTVAEGIEILTGVPSGAANGERKFEKDTVFARVNARLEQMAQALKDYH
jgi:predicted ATP-dependent protease